MLKDDLHQVWSCRNKPEAEAWLEDWIDWALQGGIATLTRFACLVCAKSSTVSTIDSLRWRGLIRQASSVRPELAAVRPFSAPFYPPPEVRPLCMPITIGGQARQAGVDALQEHAQVLDPEVPQHVCGRV